MVFVAAIYDSSNKLLSVGRRSQFGDSMTTGVENEVLFDLTLPTGFDPTTGKIKVMAWTSF